jgi:hypothetical protein
VSRQQPHDGLDGTSVLDAALVFRTPWLIVATTPILGFWVFVFWGGKNLENALWFAIGAVGTAITWSVQGWEPWNMWVNRLTRGHDEYSPIQDATRQFFKTPRLMVVHGVLIAAGAPIPWVVSGVSDLLNGQPFRPWLSPPAVVGDVASRHR